MQLNNYDVIITKENYLTIVSQTYSCGTSYYLNTFLIFWVNRKCWQKGLIIAATKKKMVQKSWECNIHSEDVLPQIYNLHDKINA